MEVYDLDNLLEKIASDDTLADDSKISYMKMIRASEGLNEVSAKFYENLAYSVAGGVLSDKERIMLELNSLVGEAYLQNTECNINLDELKSLSQRTVNCLPDNKKELLNIKSSVCIMQCDLGITPRFYTAFEKAINVKSKEYSEIAKQKLKSNESATFIRLNF